MEEIHDHIIVGSGCTGAMAAQTLVEKGVKVTMLDVGFETPQYDSIIPDKDYTSIRQNEKEQYKYLLGKNFEGLSWGKVKTGEHLTPPRKVILQDVLKYLPIDSDSFFPMESLAYGGLGRGWGFGCCEFSKPELEAAGLDYPQMLKAYETVADRIGINGNQDDATPYTLGELKNHMQPLKLDNNNRLILKKYTAKKESLNNKGFYLGRPALAVITEGHHGRKKYSYRDMDYFSDKDESGYRSWMTVDQLKKSSNFRYINQCLVISFKETESGLIAIESIRTDTKEKTNFTCKKLILAAGTLGTARIVLRSFEKYEHKIPILCNPYSYIACIQPAMMGKKTEREKVGLAQLSLFLDEDKTNFGATMASIYSYNSLMMFRIIKQASLNFSDSRILMQYLMSSFIITGIHHPEARGTEKNILLSKNANSIAGDILKANYKLSEGEIKKVLANEKKYIRVMRKLGVYAIKRIDAGMGSSIHYAGTLPFTERDELLTLASTGKLNGTKKVYVADGSGFTYLPAKGLTFSLMANAHITALNSLNNA